MTQQQQHAYRNGNGYYRQHHGHRNRNPNHYNYTYWQPPCIVPTRWTAGIFENELMALSFNLKRGHQLIMICWWGSVWYALWLQYQPSICCPQRYLQRQIPVYFTTEFEDENVVWGSGKEPDWMKPTKTKHQNEYIDWKNWLKFYATNPIIVKVYMFATQRRHRGPLSTEYTDVAVPLHKLNAKMWYPGCRGYN